MQQLRASVVLIRQFIQVDVIAYLAALPIGRNEHIFATGTSTTTATATTAYTNALPTVVIADCTTHNNNNNSSSSSNSHTPHPTDTKAYETHTVTFDQ